MGKVLHDNVLDAALNEIADNADKLFLCPSEPADYTTANSGKLASHDMTVGDGNGDYTIGDGDTSGRKLAITAQSGVSVSSNGTGTHIALCDSGNSLVLAVATCTSQAVTSGSTITVPTFDIEIGDPS